MHSNSKSKEPIVVLNDVRKSFGALEVLKASA